MNNESKEYEYRKEAIKNSKTFNSDNKIFDLVKPTNGINIFLKTNDSVCILKWICVVLNVQSQNITILNWNWK